MKSLFLVVSESKFPGNFDFDTTSDTLVSNATFPGSFVFATRTKFKFFYGCPRPFQSPTREASRPTQRGGLGGRSPPSEKQNELCSGCPRSAWTPAPGIKQAALYELY